MISLGTRVNFTQEALDILTHLNCSCSDIFTVTWVSPNKLNVRIDPPVRDTKDDYTFISFHIDCLVEAALSKEELNV